MFLVEHFIARGLKSTGTARFELPNSRHKRRGRVPETGIQKNQFSVDIVGNVPSLSSVAPLTDLLKYRISLEPSRNLQEAGPVGHRPASHLGGE